MAQLVEFTTKDKKVVSFTPHTGRQGGTLRRNWTVGEVTRKGDLYEVEIVNNTDYASYVEYGNRTVNHDGWGVGINTKTALVSRKNEKSRRILLRVISFDYTCIF